jgi:hypothetical protein
MAMWAGIVFPAEIHISRLHATHHCGSLSPTMNPPVPCIYKSCVSYRSEKSGYGYCSIHHQVACDPILFAKALSSQISPDMKEFAKDLDRGLYKKGF